MRRDQARDALGSVCLVRKHRDLCPFTQTQLCDGLVPAWDDLVRPKPELEGPTPPIGRVPFSAIGEQRNVVHSNEVALLGILDSVAGNHGLHPRWIVLAGTHEKGGLNTLLLTFPKGGSHNAGSSPC